MCLCHCLTFARKGKQPWPLTQKSWCRVRNVLTVSVTESQQGHEMSFWLTEMSGAFEFNQTITYFFALLQCWWLTGSQVGELYSRWRRANRITRDLGHLIFNWVIAAQTITEYAWRGEHGEVFISKECFYILLSLLCHSPVRNGPLLIPPFFFLWLDTDWRQGAQNVCAGLRGWLILCDLTCHFS